MFWPSTSSGSLPGATIVAFSPLDCRASWPRQRAGRDNKLADKVRARGPRPRQAHSIPVMRRIRSLYSPSSPPTTSQQFVRRTSISPCSLIRTMVSLVIPALSRSAACNSPSLINSARRFPVPRLFAQTTRPCLERPVRPDCQREYRNKKKREERRGKHQSGMKCTQAASSSP
jgi:hypothetical protein